MFLDREFAQIFRLLLYCKVPGSLQALTKHEVFIKFMDIASVFKTSKLGKSKFVEPLSKREGIFDLYILLSQ